MAVLVLSKSLVRESKAPWLVEDGASVCDGAVPDGDAVVPASVGDCITVADGEPVLEAPSVVCEGVFSVADGLPVAVMLPASVDEPVLESVSPLATLFTAVVNPRSKLLLVVTSAAEAEPALVVGGAALELSSAVAVAAVGIVLLLEVSSAADKALAKLSPALVVAEEPLEDVEEPVLLPVFKPRTPRPSSLFTSLLISLGK